MNAGVQVGEPPRVKSRAEGSRSNSTPYSSHLIPSTPAAASRLSQKYACRRRAMLTWCRRAVSRSFFWSLAAVRTRTRSRVHPDLARCPERSLAHVPPGPPLARLAPATVARRLSSASQLRPTSRGCASSTTPPSRVASRTLNSVRILHVISCPGSRPGLAAPLSTLRGRRRRRELMHDTGPGADRYAFTAWDLQPTIPCRSPGALRGIFPRGQIK